MGNLSNRYNKVSREYRLGYDQGVAGVPNVTNPHRVDSFPYWEVLNGYCDGLRNRAIDQTPRHELQSLSRCGCHLD